MISRRMGIRRSARIAVATVTSLLLSMTMGSPASADVFFNGRSDVAFTVENACAPADGPIAVTGFVHVYSENKMGSSTSTTTGMCPGSARTERGTRGSAASRSLRQRARSPTPPARDGSAKGHRTTCISPSPRSSRRAPSAWRPTAGAEPGQIHEDGLDRAEGRRCS